MYYVNNSYCDKPRDNRVCCEVRDNCWCYDQKNKCCCYVVKDNCCCEDKREEKHEEKKEPKASAQFVSGINFMPPYVGQEIIGTWPFGNVQPVEFGITAIADGKKIQLAGSNTVILQPGRYQVDTHVLVGNFDCFDPQGSDPIVTKLFLNNIPLEYTTNSVDVINQLFVLNSTQLNKENIITVWQPNTTLQWMAGNTVSADFHFDLYEASIAIVEI